MQLTAVVCTRNRKRSLIRCVRSINRAIAAYQAANAAQPKPQLLIIDNGSTDGTQEWLCKFEIEHDVVETTGLCHARNMALHHWMVITADYVLFTDDDCEVSEEWLVNHAKVFTQFPNATFFGSSTIAGYDAALAPEWLVQALQSGDPVGPMAHRELKDYEITLSDLNHPWGANMAFSVSKLRCGDGDVRLFDEALGHAGETLRLGDDTEFCNRLIRAGYWGVLHPAAPVIHHVTEERLTADYHRQWYRAAGRAGVQLRRRFGLPVRSLEEARGLLSEAKGKVRYMLEGELQELGA